MAARSSWGLRYMSIDRQDVFWLTGLVTSTSVALYMYASPFVISVVVSLVVVTTVSYYFYSNRPLVVRGMRDSGWLGDGDSLLLVDVLPRNVATMAPEMLLERLLSELRPLCATQSSGGGSNPPAAVVVEEDELGFPLYRYPAEPLRPLYEARKHWAKAPTVTAIRDSATRSALAQIEAGVANVPNSCVVNYYPDLSMGLGPHKDKTLDLEPSSPILLVSIGASRELVLRHAAGSSPEQRITLRHGSLFVLGPRTNKKWTHAVPAATAATGGDAASARRLSLTLRCVSTYARGMDAETGKAIGLSGRGRDFETIEWPGEAARAW